MGCVWGRAEVEDAQVSNPTGEEWAPFAFFADEEPVVVEFLWGSASVADGGIDQHEGQQEHREIQPDEYRSRYAAGPGKSVAGVDLLFGLRCAFGAVDAD